MNKMIPFWCAGALCCAAINAVAQQAPSTPGAPNAATVSQAAASQATAQQEAGDPRAATSPPAAAAPAPAQAASAKRSAAAAAQKSTNAADKLELGTATVTGDREQPKVMYIVPWKRSDIGDLEGKPMNSLVDEILSPVDRDVFRREVRYYETVKSSAPSTEAASTGQGEK